MSNNKVTSFDRALLNNELGPELRKVIEDWADKYGMKVNFQGGRFDYSNWTPKFEIKASAPDIPITQDLIGKNFTNKKSYFTIFAVRPGDQYPISAKTQNDKPYRLTYEQFQTMASGQI